MQIKCYGNAQEDRFLLLTVSFLPKYLSLVLCKRALLITVKSLPHGTEPF